jgi:hypothetical protein
MSVHIGARYDKIHIRHNILISEKLQYLATYFCWRCWIIQFLLYSVCQIFLIVSSINVDMNGHIVELIFAEKRKEPPGVSDTKPSSSELVNSQASAGANTTAPVNSTSGQKGSKRSRR